MYSNQSAIINKIFYTFVFKMTRFCSNHLQTASKFFSSDSHLKISFKSILKVHFFHLQSKIIKNIFKPVSNFHKNFHTILFKMAKFSSNHLQNHEKISFFKAKTRFSFNFNQLISFFKAKKHVFFNFKQSYSYFMFKTTKFCSIHSQNHETFVF